jgi:hypothetical protein
MTEKKYEPLSEISSAATKRHAIDAMEIMESYVQSNEQLAELNETTALVHDYGGKAVVMSIVKDPITGKERATFASTASFLTIQMNATVSMGNKSTPKGKAWLEWRDRREYTSTFYEPSLPLEYGGGYNLWRGFGVTPKKGSWRLMRRHIWKILCNKDKNKFKYVIRWLAWAVQNPGDRAQRALAFRGKQGAGKSIVFNEFVRIFGNHGQQVTNMNHLTGKFNSHLSETSFLFADEAYVPGEDLGQFKALITEPNFMVEPKGFAPMPRKNCLHVVMATNADLVAFATDDSRRLFINTVDDMYCETQDPKKVDRKHMYFAAIRGEIASEGTEAMLHDLLAVKLGDWHPLATMPHTEESANQKEKSDQIPEKAMLSLIEDGVWPWHPRKGSYVAKIKELKAHLVSSTPRIKDISDKSLSIALTNFGCTRQRYNGVPEWVFPQLEDMRKAYCERRYLKISDKFDEQKTWHISESAI